MHNKGLGVENVIINTLNNWKCDTFNTIIMYPWMHVLSLARLYPQLPINMPSFFLYNIITLESIRYIKHRSTCLSCGWMTSISQGCHRERSTSRISIACEILWLLWKSSGFSMFGPDWYWLARPCSGGVETLWYIWLKPESIPDMPEVVAGKFADSYGPKLPPSLSWERDRVSLSRVVRARKSKAKKGRSRKAEKEEYWRKGEQVFFWLVGDRSFTCLHVHKIVQIV